MMNIRNARFNQFGGIDCEVEARGEWVPFTASEDDSEAFGRQVYAAAAADSGTAAYVAPDPEPEPDPEEALAQARAAVNAERDRRLGTTFAFAGKSYDCDAQSLARITGAATLAGFAMGAGAEADDLRWHGGKADFTWIAADNSLTTMDAQTCFAFGNAAATNQSAHIFAGHAIKAMDPIPADFTNDKYWP